MLLRDVRTALEPARRVPKGHQLCEGRLQFHSLPIIVSPILYSWLLLYLGIECLWGIFYLQVLGMRFLVRLVMKSFCLAMKTTNRIS